MGKIIKQMKMLLALALVLFADVAMADCGQFFVQQYRPLNYVAQHHSYHVPQYKAIQYQTIHPVYYAVAYPTQANALKQQQIRSDPDYIKWLRFKAFEAGYDSALDEAKAKYSQTQNSLIVKYCVSCHGQQLTTPKGGVYIDSAIALSGDLGLKALKLLSLPDDDPNKMPPSPTILNPEEKGQIMNEILSLHKETN
jgi:cytochrome c553